ncbi:hypothetical protein TeGR_g10338 [Tetraparma gracilis]|uniref:Uncharacterized protein n=1 Tax=Tetraparma gracilis TaxID=2962635 RepID=A0ABQ6MIE1_9STRA|nr:hypothetical protein TeGR_g10338 [Tetraparma gracilis]
MDIVKRMEGGEPPPFNTQAHPEMLTYMEFLLNARKRAKERAQATERGKTADKWTATENIYFDAALDLYGEDDCESIARCVKSRDVEQCRAKIAAAKRKEKRDAYHAYHNLTKAKLRSLKDKLDLQYSESERVRGSVEKEWCYTLNNGKGGLMLKSASPNARDIDGNAIADKLAGRNHTWVHGSGRRRGDYHFY